jgi:phage terminase large subunit GpA-like protein
MSTAPNKVAEQLWEPRYMRAAARAIRPKERLSIVEWAERYETIPREEALPGPYRFDNAPWLREIAEVLHPAHPARHVYMMKGAQVAATTIGRIWIGYSMERFPCRILQVQPTLDMAKRYSRTMIAPMIRSNPIMQAIVSPERSRDGSNTILSKSIPGGGLFMTGANSAVGLRSIACRFAHADEVDAWVIDLDGEGNPFYILLRRLDSFGEKAKLLVTSTPTIKGESAIETLYEQTDKRRYFVPCPKCGALQLIIWPQVKWPTGQPHLAEYECLECSAMWSNAMRIDATRDGEWIGELEWKLPMPVGFHLSSLYSHRKTLGDRAVEFVDVYNKPEDFKTFVNTVLGETYEERGQYETSSESIARCAERYDAPVPTGVQVLTAGVDIQADRIEIEVLGWGRGEECWSIEHKLIPGDPTGWQVWEDLYTYLGQDFQGVDKPFYIQAVAIDSGYLMQSVLAAVREYTRRRPAQKTYAVKGSDDPMVKVWPTNPQRNNAFKVPLHTINVSAPKETLMSRLKEAEAVAGGHTGSLQLVHFPHTHGSDYYEQLMSERQVTRITRGRRQRSLTGRVNKMWILKPGKRNEVLDCWVYATAAKDGLVSSGYRFAAVVAPAPRPPAVRAGGDGERGADAEDLSRVAAAAVPAESRQPEKSPSPPVAVPPQVRPQARRQQAPYGFSNRRRRWTGGT